MNRHYLLYFINAHVLNGMLLTRMRSVTVSAKPTVCIATATAFAKAKIRPIDPPSSGPRLRLIRK